MRTPHSSSPQLGRASVLLAVVSAPAHNDRRDAIRRLWKRDAARLAPNWTIVFVLGRPGEPAELVDDILYLDMAEAYEYLPRKTFRTIEYFAGNAQYDYLFKTDDDCYLNVRELARFVPGAADYFGHKSGARMHKADYHFGRTMGETVLDASGYYGPWASGSGYGLSRAGAKWVTTQLDFATVESLVFEDKMVGDTMRKSDLPSTLLKKWSSLNLNEFCVFDKDDTGHVIGTSVRMPGATFPWKVKSYHLGRAGGANPLYLVGDPAIIAMMERLDRMFRRRSIFAPVIRVRQAVARRLRALLSR